MAFTKPESIKELDNDALEASIAEALEAGKELASIDDADLTDEQIEELEVLNSFFEEADAEKGAREAAAQERADKISALKSRIPSEGDKEEEAPDAEEVDVEEAPVVEEEEDEVADKSKAGLVDAAAAKRPVTSRAARNRTFSAKQEAGPAPEGMSLVAAADVPGFSSGQKFDSLADAGKAIMKRLNGLPTSGKGYTRNQALVFNLPSTEFSQNNPEYRRDSELLLAAASETRLKGGSLTAAGGWGAPSETVLDFCKIETTEGLINLPEVTITRGGVQYTKGPSFGDVFNSASGFWDMDEATAEAGTELKTSYRPSVPPFVEERLDAVGVMMEAGFLLKAGWPELVDRYAELGLVAHQHKMARKTIAGIKSFTGPAQSVPNGFGNALDIINILEVVATGIRERNVMSLTATLEVLLPHWAKQVIKVDLSNRTGVDLLDINDARINAFFSARNLRVQWLYDYQNLAADGATGIVTSYPDTVEAIMYPAGTFVKGVADVITLDTVYDSVNMKKNDYVHLFVEQGLLVTNPCNDGYAIDIPLAINGRTAAADITGNFLVAPEPAV